MHPKLTFKIQNNKKYSTNITQKRRRVPPLFLYFPSLFSHIMIEISRQCAWCYASHHAQSIYLPSTLIFPISPLELLHKKQVRLSVSTMLFAIFPVLLRVKFPRIHHTSLSTNQYPIVDNLFKLIN